MPPRKPKKEVVKVDPEINKIVNGIEEPLQKLVEELRGNLLKAARETAKAESARILGLIPKEYHNLPISEFLLAPPDDVFAAFKAIKLEDDAEENAPVMEEDARDDMEIDDAAHETSIPIAPSGQNSGRNTAADARNEIITPAGVVLPVPVLHPHKPFRMVQANDEIAFSVNGSPMILSTAHSKKKSTKSSRKAAAEAGLIVPKTENIGTSV